VFSATDVVPWAVDLSRSEYLLTFYFLVIATLALIAGLLRSVITRNEVGSRYRSAIVARMSIVGVASVSYVFLIVNFALGYHLRSGTYVAGPNSVLTMAPRYMEWSVSVPLLCLELLAVTTLAGVAARRTQLLTMLLSFLMIFSGYLGIFVFDGVGDRVTRLLIFGLVAAVFWVVVNVLLVRAVRRSYASLTDESAALLRGATTLLLSGWVVYPLIYLLEVFFVGSIWTTIAQVALCIADVVVKIGFGEIIHRIAKLRTAEDVRAGDDIHPESIWISSVKQSDAGVAREVYLAAGSEVHPTRSRPPISTAIPTPIHPDDEFTGGSDHDA
jgi:bacteriorhodopsin